MKVKLTAASIAKLKPTSRIDRYFDTSDKAPSGFLLRLTPKGARAYCLRYRVQDTGREREVTIGDAASWSLDEARARAAELRQEIARGGDPLRERKERREAPTVDDLARRFIAEALPSRAPATRREYDAMITQWIVPALGHLKLAAVTFEDIQGLHRDITAGKTVDPRTRGGTRRANAVLAVCAVMFEQAVKWKLLASNPTRGIKRNAEVARERFLSSTEFTVLMDVLEGSRPSRRDSCDVIALAAMTGARRGELLQMKWSDLDLVRGIWDKPAPTTKQRKRHTIPLSQEAVAVLVRRKAEREAGGKIVTLRASDLVFSKLTSHALERDWRAVRRAAGLDCRFHDLRHSYAAAFASKGASLPIIGAMLGHSAPGTTMRYLHLAEPALRAAAEAASQIVTGKSAPK